METVLYTEVADWSDCDHVSWDAINRILTVTRWEAEDTIKIAFPAALPDVYLHNGIPADHLALFRQAWETTPWLLVGNGGTDWTPADGTPRALYEYLTLGDMVHQPKNPRSLTWYRWHYCLLLANPEMFTRLSIAYARDHLTGRNAKGFALQSARGYEHHASHVADIVTWYRG